MKSIPIIVVMFGVFPFLLLSLHLFGQTNTINSSYNLTINGGSKNYKVKIYSSKKNLQLDRIFGLITPDSIIRLIGDSTTIFLNTKRNVVVEVKDKAISFVNILTSQVDTLEVDGKFHEKLSIYFDHLLNKANHVSSVIINGSYVKTANFKDMTLKNLTFRKSKLLQLNLQGAEISNHFLLGQVEIDSANFLNANLPSFVTLDSVNVNSKHPVDLTNLRNITSTSSRYIFDLERTIRVSDTNLDKFNLHFDRWSFHVDTLQGLKKRTWIYEKIIKGFSNAGMTTNKDYYLNQLQQAYAQQNHSDFRNWVNKVWWDNGQNKKKAVLFMFLFFGLCVAFNFFAYNKMTDIYMPRSFTEYQLRIIYKYQVASDPPNKSKLLYSKFFGVLVYTSYIFWGLKLDLNFLKIKYVPLFIIIIAQYLTGLVCVGYLISFIIVK